MIEMRRWQQENAQMTQRDISDMDRRHPSLLLSVSDISQAPHHSIWRWPPQVIWHRGSHLHCFCPLWHKTVHSMPAPTNRKKRPIHTCCSPFLKRTHSSQSYTFFPALASIIICIIKNVYKVLLFVREDLKVTTTGLFLVWQCAKLLVLGAGKS